MRFVWRLPQGTISIRAHRIDPMQCELWFEEQCIGVFPSPTQAAVRVAQRCCGHKVVDSAESLLPATLAEWKVVSSLEEESEEELAETSDATNLRISASQRLTIVAMNQKRYH